jgi:hypothetical protein
MPQTLSLAELERQMRARLEELEPLINEAEVLRRVLDVLHDPTSTNGTKTRAPRSAGTRRRRPRANSTGGRKADALRLVNERPGITVAELAKAMAIGNTYLYRLMPKLTRDGQVRKDGKGYHPAGA